MNGTTKRSAQGAHGLEAKYFTSHEIFALETDRIFTSDWLCVGRYSQLSSSGDYFLSNHARGSVIILRAEDGELRAFHNVCRHRGTELCSAHEGHFEQGIRCPYHAWTYALDGSLLGAPNMKGVEGFRPEDQGLSEVAVASWEGFVFLSLDPDPAPFDEAFKPLLGRFEDWRLDQLVAGASKSYSINANWKLIFQNYSECYHCPSVHPALNRLTPYRGSSNDLEEGPFLGGPMRLSAGIQSMTMTGQRCARPLVKPGSRKLGDVYYYTVFPNLFVSLHPDYVLVHKLTRVDVSSTQIECLWLFAPESVAEPDFDPTSAVEFWDMTNQQDWSICEASQRGIESMGYVPGPYSDLESIVAGFDKHYLTRMRGS